MQYDDGLSQFDRMGINELRAMLFEMGIEYPEKATREELIKLIEENS